MPHPLSPNTATTLICGVLWLLTLQGAAGDETRIYNDVIKASHYSSKVRPRRNSSETIDVGLEFELRHITNLDQQNQIFYTSGYIVAKWKDDYLKWSLNQYEDIDSIIVPPSQVWLPDLGVINSADTFYHDSFTKDFRVHINHEGEILWSFGGNFATTCELDLTFFPFDRQVCEIIIENWAYNAAQVNLKNESREVHLDDFQPNGEWKMEHSEVIVETIYHDTFPGKPYPRVKFEMYLQRKAGYYALNIMTPCFLIILLALLMFWLPADSGEKVSLGVTVLLALSVFQLVIADNSPKTSDFVPVLSVYVSFVMGMSAVSTFVTIVSLYFHHHLPNKSVPSLTRVVFFKYIARALCMSHDVPDMSNEITPEEQEERHPHRPPSTVVTGSIKSIKSLMTEETLMYSNQSAKGSSLPPDTKDQSSDSAPVTQYLAYLASRMKEQDKDEAVMSEWKALARVIDRLFFFICLSIIIIVCIWMFTQSEGPKHET